jgi:hypothetical protein
MVANLRELEEFTHNFAVKHGFAYRRAQDYKKCLVIRWKHRTRKDKNFIDHERIEEYVKVSHAVRDKYGLWDEKHPLLDSQSVLAKAGIYCITSWHNRLRAIPDEYKEVQDFVLSLLPSWVTVTRKE